jgi:hypothetical protein
LVYKEIIRTNPEKEQTTEDENLIKKPKIA